MLLKRLAAVFAALMILLQLASCTQDSSGDVISSSTITTSSQSASDTETHTESSWQGDSQSGSSKNEIIGTSSETSSKSDTNNSQSSAVNSETSSTGGVNEPDTPQIKPASCDHSGDPYQNINKTEFYQNYKVACCNLDAGYRSKHGLLSGTLTIPGQYVVESADMPMSGKKYIRNTTTYYLDGGNTYVVLDARGREYMRIHKDGGYIALEEVAAYMFAFGGSDNIPANYTSKKSGKPLSSIWGEYLRVNHSYFIGDTDRYPYEPELPDISGCGGRLRYYEMDIGTTGTTTPGYPPEPYIEGNKINRGAARIVYARQDLNGNGVYENNEVYVFYTHNHYNDFREYLNYYGGWGEMFGNVTGGGIYSSKTKANPTPYVSTAYKAFFEQ